MTEPKPCPFCQKSRFAFWSEGNPDEKISVYCMSCMARGPKAKTEEIAIQMWNERGEQ